VRIFEAYFRDGENEFEPRYFTHSGEAQDWALRFGARHMQPGEELTVNEIQTVSGSRLLPVLILNSGRWIRSQRIAYRGPFEGAKGAI
jgi:hypothetical protein